MIQNIIKWIFLISATAVIVGTASAGFLNLLDFTTQIRVRNLWLIYSLPLIGLVVSFIYLKINPSLNNGNEYIIRNFLNETGNEKPIPIALAPLVFAGTILTHLGGGSAGREGTAVQMGASIASQFNRWTKLDKPSQRLLTCIGVSAGFAAVFGTPLAASIFALEFFSFKKTKWYFILPTILTAYLAHWTCLSWGIEHPNYNIVAFNEYSIQTIGWIGIAGLIFGLTALLYLISTQLFTSIFSTIQYPPLRTLIGGMFIAALILLTHQEKLSGLGLTNIQDAFIHSQGNWDFLLKLLLTSLTLSLGFKGGEVTPLFFIGAVLGSILITFIPLPISLLAGLGLVAVFAGATHCLVSAMVLGIELFGSKYAVYIFIVCIVAYLFSGAKNIYAGRPNGWIKEKIQSYFL